jgi:hypothetical protein
MNGPDIEGDFDFVGNKVVLVLDCMNVGAVDRHFPGSKFLPGLCTDFADIAFAVVVVGEDHYSVGIVEEAVDIAVSDPNCMNGIEDFEKEGVEGVLGKLGWEGIDFDLAVEDLDIYPGCYNGYCDRHMEDFCMIDFDP